MSNQIKHFDCTKNKVPKNFVDTGVRSGFFAQRFWKKCKCTYGVNPCNKSDTKWQQCEEKNNKWVKGCDDKCSEHNYYDIFGKCNQCEDCTYYKSCNKCKNPCKPCKKKCNNKCDPNNTNICDCIKCLCIPTQRNCCKPGCKKTCCNQLKTVVTDSGCGDCRDVAISYRLPKEDEECDNIVEFRVPVNGTKERFLAKNFSPEFARKCKYQYATVPVFNCDKNNLIDNMREVEFTESDQRALTSRGINNALHASQLLRDGKLENKKHCFKIPMNVCGRSSYFWLGGCGDHGSTLTGLAPEDASKIFFSQQIDKFQP